MENHRLFKLAKTVLALVLAIVVILPLNLGKPIGGKPTGGNTIGGTPIVYGAFGDEGEDYHHE